MSKLYFRSVTWSLLTMKMQIVPQGSSWIVFPDWTLILLISLPWLIDLTYLSQIFWSSKCILMFLTINEDTYFFNAFWLKETRHSCSNYLTDLQCASWAFVMFCNQRYSLHLNIMWKDGMQQFSKHSRLKYRKLHAICTISWRMR